MDARIERPVATRASLAIPLAIVAVLAGCSAIIEPDGRRLGGNDVPVDSGRDADRPRPDAGTIVNRDSGSPRDSGRPNGCTAPPRCEGDVLVRCDGALEVREDCQANSGFCAVDRCAPWICQPGTRQCSPDNRSSIQCTDRGDMRTTEECSTGCDRGSGECFDFFPSCLGLPVIAPGSPQQFDLCDEDNESTHLVDPDCPRTIPASSGERIFVLNVVREANYTIELSDDDNRTPIDTIVYLRTNCEQTGTQLACDDDVPCSMSTLGGSCSGFEVRQARIRRRLSPGTYYVVADAFLYDAYECGRVRLSVRQEGG